MMIPAIDLGQNESTTRALCSDTGEYRFRGVKTTPADLTGLLEEVRRDRDDAPKLAALAA